MKINQLISKFNFTRYTNRNIQYLVIHWVGAVSKAKDNAKYFAGGDRRASAHYFVDDTSIWQSVEDKNASWNCGGGLQGPGGHSCHGKCSNANSIGIEMCLDKPGHISDKTISNTAELVQSLMKKYEIPASHVIRHYDITGKDCPAPYCYKNNSKWPALRDMLTGAETVKTKTSKPAAKSAIQIPKPVLKIRSVGEEVRKLQTLLKISVDGSFGPKTEAALKTFQKKYKLTADGSYGPATAARFKEVFKK